MCFQQCCRPLAIEELRRRIARLETAGRTDESPPISCGCNALDALLPDGGVRRGTLVEWLAEEDGTGATTLAVLTAREACRQGGALVVVDGGRQFYPPAAVRLGIALDRLLLIRVDNRADHDWAFDQALRCSAVAAAIAWPESLAGRLDGRTFRRLQLAAERSGSLGLLLRPASVRDAPSWADLRFLVEPRPLASPQAPRRRLRVVLLRGRGGAKGRSVELEFDDETHPLLMAAPWSPAAIRVRDRAFA